MDTFRRKRRNRRGATSTIGRTIVLAVVMSMFAVMAPSGTNPLAAAPTGVDRNGRWGPVENWPMVAIHSALDSRGRVVTYGTNGDGTQTGKFIYDTWTPNASAAFGHTTLANTTTTDIFCSLQINRPDNGNMMIFGGDNWTGTNTTNTGNPDINELDAATSQLQPRPAMNRARWYATAVTMPDGTFYIQGGLGGGDRPERWDPKKGAQLLPISTDGVYWYYPRNFVIPDGRVFGMDATGRMFFVSPTLDSLTMAGNLPADRYGIGSTAVMFEPGKILHFGGPTNTAVIIDLTSGTPVISRTGSLSSARQWVDATLLPDGRVMANGGATKSSSQITRDDINTYGVNYKTEIWDPATGQWTLAAENVQPRLYHSTSLLLPDGRVLVAGGGSPGPVTNADAEIYSPDYLVAAGGGATVRPSIESVSADSFLPGEAFRMTTSGATPSRVTLVKTGSVTHSFNMEQRFIELPFQTTGDTTVTRIPASSAVVTPGYYLLSIIDANGIPSKSELIRVEVPDPKRPVAGVDGQITRLYQGYFQRPADVAGYTYWRNQLLAGKTTIAAVSDYFAANGEFNARYGALNNEQFVNQVYQNVLGRPADGAGRTYWLGQLANGVTRGTLMLSFTDSAEFVNKTGTPSPAAPNGMPRAYQPVPVPGPAPTPGGAGDPALIDTYRRQIYRLYFGYFDRAPDGDGWNHWVEMRLGGLTLPAVSQEFALSSEFASIGLTSNGDFVDYVYRNVLDREPDQLGRQFWINQLNSGMTRGEMMTGFTESREFVIKVGFPG